MRRFGLMVLAGALATASGCSTTNTNLTKEQVEQIEICKANVPTNKRIKTQSVSMGCVASMAFNRMISSNNPGPLICMAGGASGLLLGESIAERKCHYLTQEDQLDGEIAHAAKMNSGFSIVFAQQALELKKLQATAGMVTVKKAEDEKSRKALESFEASLNETLAKEQAFLREVQDEFRFKRATLSQSKALDAKEKQDKLLAEIRALQESIKKLQEHNEELAKLKSQLHAA